MADGKPLKGVVKLRLIRELAAAEKTQAQLAIEYNVSEARVSQFKYENLDAISHAQANMLDEFAGILLADKKNRLAEYVSDVDEANERDGDGWVDARRIKHNALRQIAEELGQIPNKTTMSHEGKVEYVIEGIDLNSLK